MISKPCFRVGIFTFSPMYVCMHGCMYVGCMVVCMYVCMKEKVEKTPACKRKYAFQCIAEAICSLLMFSGELTNTLANTFVGTRSYMAVRLDFFRFFLSFFFFFFFLISLSLSYFHNMEPCELYCDFSWQKETKIIFLQTHLLFHLPHTHTHNLSLSPPPLSLISPFLSLSLSRP